MTAADLDLDADSRRLAARIVDAVPVTQLAFLKLLGLLDIRASRTVPNACVTLGARSRLLINPDFVRAHCASDEALVMLVLHELFHVLLGHTRLYPLVTPALNWALDALINAHLCQLLPDPAHTALFRTLYRAERFPEALLRPPEGWRTPDARWALTGQALEVHRALYTDCSATHAELLELVRQSLGSADVQGTDGLLGSHDAAEDAGTADPDLVAALRDIVAEWPMLERRCGRDQGGALEQTRLELATARRSAVGVIRRALLPLLDLGAGFNGAPHPDLTTLDGVLPYRTLPDRRAAVRAAWGQHPLLYRAQMAAPGIRRVERTHVYVDVSGSMAAALPILYAALVPLLGYLHPQVHLFSTRVADIAPGELRSGLVESTWGTEIACVTGHLLAQRVRRALILTDGWVGEPPSGHVRALQKRGLRLGVLVTDGGDPAFAGALGARVARLPPLH
jgi:hypothetical protein